VAGTLKIITIAIPNDNKKKMRSCWWAVSLRTSQSSPKAELPLLVSHDTRKGATVSTRSKLCQCSALEIPACSCALCSTRGSGHRDTQSVSPRLEHTARSIPQRAMHADDAAPPSASGAEGREKRNAPRGILLSPSPSLSRRAPAHTCADRLLAQLHGPITRH
jgi:hypothetical protein